MHLPLGYDDFRELIDNRLDFVDKTLFIKEIIDDIGTKIVLITRPRRFGKTLNLSMLRYFFAAEAYGQKTEHLFDGLNISRAGDAYLQHQGKYPVIFLTLKDVKDSKFESAYASLTHLIGKLYAEHRYVLEGTLLHAEEKQAYETILTGEANETKFKSALLNLSEYLYRYHKVKPIILIDEYDTPIQHGYMEGYYDEIIDFMRNFFSEGLKSNSYLHKAVLTGILRISKESLFSGLNNLRVYSLLHPRYSEYFGFTEIEVNALLQQSQKKIPAETIKDWYNGYQVGDTVIYNPWSIVNCLEDGVVKPYWTQTSGNTLIKEAVIQSSSEFKALFERLLQKQTVEKLIDENFVFGDLKRNESILWSLLLMTGYLKVVSSERIEDGLSCRLAIPNREIYYLYLTLIKEWLSNGHGIDWYGHFLNELLQGNVETFEEKLQEILLRIVSVHDAAKSPEAFYHGFLLGLTVGLNDKHYLLKSNRESGYGRYDIAIIPKDPDKLGILIECKAAKTIKQLPAAAKQALNQINLQHYATELQQYGSKRILKIGLALHGKRLALRHDTSTR